MSLKYYAYIDEAGDEGLGKLKIGNSGQSRWFVIGGIVVSESHDAQLPTIRDNILNLFPHRRKNDLHFRNLNHGQRVAACHEFAKHPFKIVSVCSNKITIVDDKKYYPLFKQKGYLYNYLTRYWLERVTERCAEIAKQSRKPVELHVRFSRRSGTDYHAMREYFELQRDGNEVVKPPRSIAWSVFDPQNIRVENHSNLAGLQLADLATSATASALEANAYGHTETRYAEIISKQYLDRQNNIVNCDLTIVPGIGHTKTPQSVRDFSSILQEKWQAPGP